MDPLEDPLRGEPSRTAMMLTPGRVDEVEAAAMLSMPATAAGIGAAGRKGIAMDPLEDPPGGEPSGMAVKPNGTTEETPELKEATACAQVFSTRATSRDARAAKIPKGGGPSPENIRSLHLAYRGGAARRENAGRVLRGPGGKVPRNSGNTHASAWSSSNSFRMWEPTVAAARKVWPPTRGRGILPFLGPKAPAAALAPDETRPVRSGALPSAAMMPNGRTGAAPGRVVEVEAAAMLSVPTTVVGIGTAGARLPAEKSKSKLPRCSRYRQRVWVSEQGDARLPRCSRCRQRLRVSEQRGARALPWTPLKVRREASLQGRP